MANHSEQFSISFTEGQPNWEDWITINQLKGVATAGQAAKALLMERTALVRAGWMPGDMGMFDAVVSVIHALKESPGTFPDLLARAIEDAGKIGSGREGSRKRK